MPQLVRVSPEELARLRSTKAAAEYLGHHMEELRASEEPYIVLRGKEVVARGATPENAMTRAIASGAPPEELILVRAPRPAESYFF